MTNTTATQTANDTGRTRRQRQLPWIGAGLLLILSSTIGFALWTTSQNQRTPILIVTSDLPAGTTLQPGHVQIASIATDPGITLPTTDQYEAMIGDTLAVNLPAGTPLTHGHLTDPHTPIPDGTALVGVTLAPGAYPSSNLTLGDTVDIIATTPNDNQATTITTATIWADQPHTGTGAGQRFLTLLVTHDTAAHVADVANGGGLRLIQRPNHTNPQNGPVS